MMKRRMRRMRMTMMRMKTRRKRRRRRRARRSENFDPQSKHGRAVDMSQQPKDFKIHYMILKQRRRTRFHGGR